MRSETTPTASYKTGGAAANSGKELPADVAKAIDPSGATVKAGTKVNRGALVNANMTGGEPNLSSKSSSTPQQNNANGATTNGQTDPKSTPAEQGQRRTN